MERTVEWTLAWHWINLSNTSKGSCVDKVTIRASSLPSLPDLSLAISPSFLSVCSIPPFSPTSISSNRVWAYCLLCAHPDSPSPASPQSSSHQTVLQLHYSSAVSGAPVSRWDHVRKHLRVHNDLQPVALRARLYSWHLALNQPQCLQAQTDEFRLLVSLEGWVEM